MNKSYTVREFIRLTPPQKERLQKRDPEQYKRLLDAANDQFSTESDPVACAALTSTKGKSKL